MKKHRSCLQVLLLLCSIICSVLISRVPKAFADTPASTQPAPSTGSGTPFTPRFDSDPLIPFLIFCGIALVVGIMVILVKHHKK